MRAFAAGARRHRLRRLPAGRHRHRPHRVRPTWTPSTRSPRRTPTRRSRRSLHQGYISARLADLAPALTRESTGIDARRPALPRALGQADPGPHRGRAREPGASGRDRLRLLLPRRRRLAPGTVLRADEQLFGIPHQLDVGLDDPIEDDVVELTFTRDFGGLTRGTTLTLARRRQRAQPGLPARQPRRRRGHRDRRPRPPRAAAPPGRRRLADPVHLPAGVHGGGHAPGQPRRDRRPVRRARRPRRGAAAGEPSRPAGRLRHPGPRRRRAVRRPRQPRRRAARPSSRYSAAGGTGAPLADTLGERRSWSSHPGPFGIKVLKITES